MTPRVIGFCARLHKPAEAAAVLRFRFSVLHQNILTALSEAREAAGISQRELSKRLKGDRNYNYVNLLEKGQRMPNACELFVYIDAIGADRVEVVRRIDALSKARAKHASERKVAKTALRKKARSKK